MRADAQPLALMTTPSRLKKGSSQLQRYALAWTKAQSGERFLT
jgi:hypothetical protein